MRNLTTIFLTTVIAGCGAAPTKPPVACEAGDKVEFVDRIVTVRVDPTLTAKPGTKMDTWDLEPGTTYNEAAAAARRRGALLGQCHAQLDAIGDMDGRSLDN